MLFCLTAPAAQAQGRVIPSERGIASWYGGYFHGRYTANGERFSMYAMTAAHKSLPFGIVVRVRRIAGGSSIVVRINDRGPFVEGRIIDLSRSAAQALGVDGIASVQLDVVAGKNGRPYAVSQRFYVRLGRECDITLDGAEKVAHLVRLGIHDAATLLRRNAETYVVGPFVNFQDAHDAYARVELMHPGSAILLAGKDWAEAVFPEHQCE